MSTDLLERRTRSRGEVDNRLQGVADLLGRQTCLTHDGRSLCDFGCRELRPGRDLQEGLLEGTHLGIGGLRDRSELLEFPLQLDNLGNRVAESVECRADQRVVRQNLTLDLQELSTAVLRQPLLDDVVDVVHPGLERARRAGAYPGALLLSRNPPVTRLVLVFSFGDQTGTSLVTRLVRIFANRDLTSTLDILRLVLLLGYKLGSSGLPVTQLVVDLGLGNETSTLDILELVLLLGNDLGPGGLPVPLFIVDLGADNRRNTLELPELVLLLSDDLGVEPLAVALLVLSISRWPLGETGLLDRRQLLVRQTRDGGRAGEIAHPPLATEDRVGVGFFDKACLGPSTIEASLGELPGVGLVEARFDRVEVRPHPPLDRLGEVVEDLGDDVVEVGVDAADLATGEVGRGLGGAVLRSPEVLCPQLVRDGLETALLVGKLAEFVDGLLKGIRGPSGRLQP